MATRRGCRVVSPPERKSPAGLPGSPPVLTLSHFCPKPFLCFGDVRLGASKTLPLALLNPNAEAAAVTLPRCPAAAQGFEVRPRAVGLQPKEKVIISVTWTPIKEGRVREILTFHVNGIVKHEVILLGNAEEPKKKKRSLWDTINKKKVSAPSSRKKKISNIHNVNKMFSVSQKVDRVRSPLQACENLGRKEGCSAAGNSSLVLEEGQIPISPISPTFKGCRGETCLPLCVRRSTTYTSLHAPENGELWNLEDANTSKDFNEGVLTETSLNSINNNGQIEDDSKLILTPNYSSTLNVTQSHGSFLSPDSFLKNSHGANNDLKLVPCISSDTFLKDNSRPMHLESKTVHEVYQIILSPDSFLKDNYGLSQEVESESVNPILSPSQFIKDNITHRCISQQTCKLSPLLNENSQASESPQVQRKNEVLLSIPECQGSNSPETIFEEPKSSEMKPNCDSFTKHNQPRFSAVQDISGYSHNIQLKRRPILSATVTKLKPTGNREHKTQTGQPKARKCLRSVEIEPEKVTGDVEEEDPLRSYLPVIDSVVSSSTSCEKVIEPSSNAASAARKRKSEGSEEEGARVLAGVTDHTEAQVIKRIPFAPGQSKTPAAKKTRKVVTPVSRHISNREKLNLAKRTDSLPYKTPNSKINRRTKRIVPVAQSNLTFIKPLKTDIPRHPMPFAARNMFYDERWKEKQQQGFTWWLNFVLTPDDLTVKTSVSEVNAAALLLGVESQHKLSVPRAPTKDEMSLRAYTARCRLNRLRRAACRLFTSEKMVKAIKKLEIEIEARRLVVRKDRHLWKDVGERRKVLSWLLSYNPLWLRIGLETVFGELLALEDNSDVMGMAVFILNRLLWNPDIAAEYRHPSVPHLYRDGHEEALSQFTLKKLLLLVCFLDYAKVSRLIDHDPCLFCKDAEFKTSKDLLLAFSRDFLSGEGDLSRHLSLLGLPVSHAQTPFDEFDFAVTNLAVDLQCGVRLVRAVELLTQNWDLSKRLRVPAVSRLQKIHNVDLALQTLRAHGVRLQDELGNAILPKDIVDRHREKTLALLWKIALAFQVDISVNLHQLKEEIDFLRHTWSLKKTMSTLSSRRDAARGGQADPSPRGSSARQSESVGLLMEWVNAVCAFYSTKVENFTVSFSDGRVLCYLVHHYHPGYVPFDAICQRTTQTVACTQTGSVVLNSSSESEESCLDVSLKAPDDEGTAEVHRELLENEKKNFQLLGSAVRDLGGVPAMLHHADMSNTIPDEKVVITFLSFLCARLLDLRRETRAARLIQTVWRKHKLESDLRRHQARDKAARVIQSAVTRFLARRRLKKEVSAARVIQKHWRRFLRQRESLMLKKAELERVQNESALVVQKYWRRYSTRKKFLKLKNYSIILQSRIRTKMAVASYKRCVWAAVTIQSQWRACVRRRQDQQRYRTLKSSCLVIQSVFRRWQSRKMQLQRRAAVTLQRAFREWHARKRAEEEKSATVIQSWYRMHRELRRYSHTRSCVLTIQAEFRRFQAQKLYRRKREAVQTIQTRWRAHLEAKVARARYLQKRAAAVRIQAAFRAVRARRLRRRDRAAHVLQSYWRMRQERLRFLALRKTVVTLQAHVRKCQQLQKYKKMQKAALAIQTRFRAHVAARAVLASYQRTRSAAIVLQAAYRARRARKAVRHTLTCVVRIQSCYRTHVCRKHFLTLKHATVKLQSTVRMQQARKRYLRLRAAAVFVQQRYRFLHTAARRREELRQVLEACVRLQAWARGHLVRRQVRLQRAAATSLQAHFRMRTARRSYLRMRWAALVIQTCYRAHRARLQQREAHAQRAATRLQAAFRGHCVRRLLRRRALAALTIQSAFRGRRERANYRRVLQSAVQIQRWYRANCAARGLRTQFLKMRAAVLTLQAAYRGWRIRERIRRERWAAVAVQTAFRRARAQRQFQQLKAAALALQRCRRAQATGRAQRGDYLRLRQAALTLQAAWRGRAARRQIQRRHQCAVLIQSCYRMHAQRRRWVAVRKAARRIQTWYRACYQVRRQRLSYLKMKAAVLVLQSAHRRMRERRKRAEEHSKAATTIQAGYRAHRARKRWAACRAAAVAIQRWYRSVKIANRQHKEYLHLKKAATRIQAVYRGARVRRHIRRMHMAATCIKTTFQMHLLKTRYRKMRAAAVLIQVRYRAYCRGKTQRAHYLAVLKAVDILQASFRGARVRWNLRKMQAAAVVIQSSYRRHREQGRFRRVKAATRTVQRKYRALKAGSEQLQRYMQLRRAAILVQAVFRGMRARRRVKALHSAAALIQRRFRALRMRRRFLSLRKTAIWVQRKYRAKVHEKHHFEFLQLQEAAITIQSSFRGWVVRKRLQEMHGAATVIQATFRMHRAQVSYQALRHTAVLMQRHYRACGAAELQRERFVCQRHCAVVMQAACRGSGARQLLQEMHGAAALTQSTYRTHRRYVFSCKVQGPTTVVREKYRASKRKALGPSTLGEAGAQVQVRSQDLAVGRQGQEQHLAATAVQKHFRAFRVRKRYLRMRAAVVFVQRRHRAIAAARAQAALRLQASHGGAWEEGGTQGRHLAAPSVRAPCGTHGGHAACPAQRGAVAVVQSRCGPCVRVTAGRRPSSAVRTSPAAQAAFRDMETRLELENTEEKMAATTDRPASRCGVAETGQEAAPSLAVGPRACPETLVAGSWATAGHSQSRAAVIVPDTFQTMATGTLGLDLELWAALRIQSFLRMAVCRRRFVQQRRAAVTLQLSFRAWRARRQFSLWRRAAVVLQTRLRACLSAKRQRRAYLQARSSAIIIQARMRGFLQKRRFRKIKESTLKMQMPEERARTRLLRFTAAAWHHLCALRIQRAYRRHLAVQSARSHLHAVICIQRWFRARLQLKRQMQMCDSLVSLNREREEHWRRRQQAAAVIQKAARCFLCRRERERFRNGIVRVQALWRGYSWRKGNDCARIKAMRRRLQAVNAEVREEDTLSQRAALGLHCLLTCRHLSAILEALKHLEVVTRLSPLCCESVARSGGVSKVLVLIRSCNRSVPCMDVISHAVQVLLNLAKYEKTAPAVCGAEACVRTLLELLQVYREKPGDKVADKSRSIFTKTCCLLAVLLKATSRASDVRNRSEVVDCVCSVYKVTARTHGVNTGRMPCKQNKNGARGVPFIPETPVRTRAVARLKPDWVLSRDTTREAADPLRALQMVMDTLGVPY